MKNYDILGALEPATEAEDGGGSLERRMSPQPSLLASWRVATVVWAATSLYTLRTLTGTLPALATAAVSTHLPMPRLRCARRPLLPRQLLYFCAVDASESSVSVALACSVLELVLFVRVAREISSAKRASTGAS